MNEGKKDFECKRLQRYFGEGSFEEFSFNGSDVLLKKFEENFGGPKHDRAKQTGFFKSSTPKNEVYFCCVDIDCLDRDDMDLLNVFIHDLEEALYNIGYTNIKTRILHFNGCVMELIMWITYHIVAERNPIDEWENMSHFCFKHCTECTDCPLKKNKKEGEPCEYSKMVTQVFALHDKMFPILTCDSCGKERELFKVNSDGKELNVCDSCYGLYAPDEEDEV